MHMVTHISESHDASCMLLLDRHCKSCRDMHATASSLAPAAQLLASALFVAAVASLAARGPSMIAGALAVASALLAAAAYGLRKLVQQFEFVDYDAHHPSKRP